MIHVSSHAISRYRERVAPVSYDEAVAALSTAVIERAAAFGARYVRLPSPAPSPETKTMTEKLKATYEARYCPDIPTDCCDYGVISHETGKEVCRVWDRDDAERITALLNTRHHTPANPGRLVDWRGHCEWLLDLDEIHVGEGETDVLTRIASIRAALHRAHPYVFDAAERAGRLAVRP